MRAGDQGQRLLGSVEHSGGNSSLGHRPGGGRGEPGGRGGGLIDVFFRGRGVGLRVKGLPWDLSVGLGVFGEFRV